jgi:glycerophosphoryl diester phosphodiesterase
MTKRWKRTWDILVFQWKRLLLFELFWRLFGLAVLFPLFERLAVYSIKLTGKTYLVNRDIIDHLLRPSTMVIGLLILLLFGLYVATEVVALSILFHESRYHRELPAVIWFKVTMIRLWKVLRSTHLLFLFSSMIFLAMVEGLHVVGIASTIELPPTIRRELSTLPWIRPALGLLAIATIYLFFETLFFELHAVIDRLSLGANLRQSRLLLSGRRGRLIVEFLLLNAALNAGFYLLYVVVVALVGLAVSLLSGGGIAFVVVLTTLYAIYLVIGLVASVVLIPVNYAWIHSHFYESRPAPDPSLVLAIGRIRSESSFPARRFRRFLGALNVVLVGLVVLFFSVPEVRATGRINLLDHPMIVSHRGGGYYAPENTLAAIDTGIALGADAIELDVRFTSDGVPVLMHDTTTTRTTDDALDRRIDRMTILQVETLDAGSWYDPTYEGEGVPTLAAALQRLDGRADLLLELKHGNDQNVASVLTLLAEADMTHRTRILSFRDDLLRRVKAQDPSIDTVRLLRYFIGDVEVLLDADHIDHFGVHYDVAIQQVGFIETLRQAGKGVYVWTPNTTDVLQSLDRIGVDAVITSEPLLAREVLYGDTTRSLFRDLLRVLFQRSS